MMPINVKSADGKIHAFPDGTPIENIDKAMKAYATQQQGGQGDQGDQRSFGEKLGQGFMDPFYGMAQIGARMEEPGSELPGALPITADQRTKLIETVDSSVKQREQEIAQKRGKDKDSIDWWRLGGTALNPVTYAGALIGGLPGAAASGLMAGMTQPTTNTDNFLQQKTTDALMGAAFGTAGGAVPTLLGKAVSPIVSKAAQGLLKAGVELTPGRLAGAMMSRIEDAAKSIPWLGQFVRNAQRRSYETFNIAAINQALSPVGVTLPGNIAAGRSAVEAANSILSNKYDQLLPTLSMRVDAQFAHDLAALNTKVGELPPDLQTQFQNIINNRMANPLAKGGGALTGQELKEVESQLGSFARKYLPSRDPAQQTMGELFGEAQDILRGALMRQNPNSDELKKLNLAWAMFKRIQRASTRRVGAGGDEGIFSPTDLGAAVKILDSTGDKAAYARGDALMQEFAEWGQFLLPSKLPDSGTTERYLWAMLGLGGELGSHYSPGLSLKIAATVGTAALPFTKPATRAASKLATPGAKKQAFRRGMEAVTPAVGGISKVVGSPTLGEALSND